MQTLPVEALWEMQNVTLERRTCMQIHRERDRKRARERERTRERGIQSERGMEREREKERQTRVVGKGERERGKEPR